MAVEIQRSLDFGGARKILNLPDPSSAQDAATKAYVDSIVEGLAWKDSCRVSTQGNISLATPGATIDGISMVSGDRVLVRAQTDSEDDGIYIWNGASTLMTRALDMSVASEVEQAITTVEEGTNAGVSYRQSVVNVTLGTTPLSFTVFGSSVGASSESSAGILEIATQAETDAGTDDARAITPLKAKSSVFSVRKYTANIGDTSATSFAITHNFNTRSVHVEVYRNSGNYDTILCEVQRTSVNAVTLIFDVAPSTNQFTVAVWA